MPESPEFLIEGILPANEVHLICGASGSGKTTWTFQEFLAEWQAGRPVSGHQSNPVPYVYIALDRTRASVMRTLERLDLVGSITRIVCLGEIAKAIPDKSKRTLEHILAYALHLYSDTKLFIIEGFALMAGGKSKDYGAVAEVMQDASIYCEKHKLTVIGICHAPKMKKDEKFQHSREMLLGSVSWAAYGESVLVLDYDESLKQVTLRILPRNAASEVHQYVFSHNGTLLAIAEMKPRNAIKARIEALSAGELLNRADILEWATASGASRATADRVTQECLKNKVLERIDEGIFERTDRQPLVLVPPDDITVEA